MKEIGLSLWSGINPVGLGPEYVNKGADLL